VAFILQEAGVETKITEITRRDIFEALAAEGVSFFGRLDEVEFLGRVWDLGSMPSYDGRFPDAARDIWQHRVHNYDWEDDWFFHDERFGLMDGDDKTFLKFVCEMIHPEVRPDVKDAERICQICNNYLKNDGFEIAETSRISGKPVYDARYIGVANVPGIEAAKETFSGTDLAYIKQQVARMETSVNQDPDLAIGTAKELVETCCKSILSERGISSSKGDDLPKLVKTTAKELDLTPDDIPAQAKARDTIKRLLSNLSTIAQDIAELRNQYGTGHGRDGKSKGLQARHAKLAVGAASTLAVFLVETHRAGRGGAGKGSQS